MKNTRRVRCAIRRKRNEEDMKITIDRIEKGFVVAELPGGQTVNIPEIVFPGAVEGDIYTIVKDCAERDARRSRIDDKMKRLFED